MSKKQQNRLKVHYDGGQANDMPETNRKEQNSNRTSDVMSDKSVILTKLLPWLSVLLLALFSFYFLLVRNADVLYMAQLHSLFVSGQQFFDYRMQTPGGLIDWAGCWLTQLFYYPWLGTLVLTLLWVITFYIIKKAFGISNALSPIILVPLLCLLASEIDLGYWIYSLKMPGYWFRGTLGVMSVALLVLMSRSVKADNKVLAIAQQLIVPILAASLYPLIGYYSAVAGVCMALTMAISKRWIGLGMSVVATVVAPLLFAGHYDSIQLGATYSAGFPVFEAIKATDDALSTPFYAIVVSLFAFSILPLLNGVKGKGKAVLSAASAVIAMYSAWQVSVMEYDDEAYMTECKVYPEVCQQRWDDALADIGKCPGALTRELIILKNICLFNNGEIGNRIYDYDDAGTVPTPSDSLHVSLVQLAAPLIYNQHGLVNYAIRWGIENSVEFGYSVDNLQQLTVSALVAGEMKVARKYLDILRRTMFYAEWADRYIPLTENPKLISQYKELNHIRDIYSQMVDNAGSDMSLCERFIVNGFSRINLPGSKYSQEMTLVYAMISKDIQNFWPRYMQYLSMHKGEKVPAAYQQAACLYSHLEPQTAPDSSKYDLGIAKETREAFSQFLVTSQQLVKSGMPSEAVGDNMKSQFGSTFWWTYFFVRDSKYY